MRAHTDIDIRYVNNAKGLYELITNSVVVTFYNRYSVRDGPFDIQGGGGLGFF